MEFEEFSSKVSHFFRSYWLPVTLLCLGLIFFGYGLISLLNSNHKDDFTDFNSQTEAEEPTLISVDIEGAVINPGVYKLSIGSIVQDVLVLSKGLSEDADREYVSKNINLASKLSDGAKIYIPKLGESNSKTDVLGKNELININSASEDDLNSLPGIGPVTSQKIINLRPYSTTDELVSKKAVSNKVFSEIKDKITAF